MLVDEKKEKKKIQLGAEKERAKNDAEWWSGWSRLRWKKIQRDWVRVGGAAVGCECGKKRGKGGMRERWGSSFSLSVGSESLCTAAFEMHRFFDWENNRQDKEKRRTFCSVFTSLRIILFQLDATEGAFYMCIVYATVHRMFAVKVSNIVKGRIYRVLTSFEMFIYILEALSIKSNFGKSRKTYDCAHWFSL